MKKFVFAASVLCSASVAVAGFNGVDVYNVSSVVPGEPLMFDVGVTDAFGRVAVVIGAPGQTCPAQLGGQCVDVANARVATVFRPDAPVPGFIGETSVTVVTPQAAVPGTSLVLQAVGLGRGLLDLSYPRDLVVAERLVGFGTWTAGGQSWEIEHQEIRSDVDTWTVAWSSVDGTRAVVEDIDGFGYDAFDFAVAGDGSKWVCFADVNEDVWDLYDADLSDDADPATSGCNGGAWTLLEPAEVEIAGFFNDNWGGTHTIESDTWEQGSGTWHVSRFSNFDGVVIAQNDETNTYSPGLWSRFDWIPDGSGGYYYCQVVFDAASEWEARTAPAPDASNPEVDGCGSFNFSWSRLTSAP